jgi:hypothetical protein
MRQAFAHEASLRMARGVDTAAPGAAITVELCGSLDHESPCPVANHHTAAVRRDEEVLLRVLFAAEPEREREAREAILRALEAGSFEGPHGRAEWQLEFSGSSSIAPDELDHAERLTRDWDS